MSVMFYIFRNVNSQVLVGLTNLQAFLAILFRLGRLISLEEKDHDVRPILPGHAQTDDEDSIGKE